MVRRALLIMLVILVLLLSAVNVAGKKIKEEDVKIGPEEDEGELLLFATEGEEVEVSVTSDMQVNVYIMRSEDYKFGIDPEYSNAKLSKEQITTTDFTYKIPDERTYYLVIYNPNNVTATVTYEYTDTFEEGGEWLFFGFAAVVCIAIIAVVGIIILLLIIYFVFFSKKKKKKKKETLPPPPEAGLEQPPPPPGKGKKKGGKKSKKEDEDEPPEQLEFDEEPPKKKKGGMKSKKKSED